MDETQNQSENTVTTEPVQQEPVSQPDISPEKKSNSFATLLVVGAVVVAIAAVAIVYFNGQKDVVGNNGIDLNEVVATVNGVDIVGADLSTSINQIAATAQLQGVDTTDPSVQADIKLQAVQMLVNTELLEQEAGERGIEITDGDVDDRITALVQEIGSEEALNERMSALGIDQDTLLRDVKSELLIQELLDQVFTEKQITITDEEVTSLYESTTAGDESAPPLAEVRSQVEAQIRTSKEQAALDEFISSLRLEAQVEITE